MQKNAFTHNFTQKMMHRIWWLRIRISSLSHLDTSTKQILLGKCPIDPSAIIFSPYSSLFVSDTMDN